MTQEKVICDGCGKLQGESNHWSIVVCSVPPWADGGWSIVLANNRRVVNPKRLLKGAGVFDVCGSACEQKMIAQLRERKSATVAATTNHMEVVPT